MVYLLPTLALFLPKINYFSINSFSGFKPERLKAKAKGF